MYREKGQGRGRMGVGDRNGQGEGGCELGINS
jgi:hypothetical protein